MEIAIEYLDQNVMKMHLVLWVIFSYFYSGSSWGHFRTLLMVTGVKRSWENRGWA